jgi:[acyl-carrier-protein] S-malonyltransferase
MEGVPVPGEVLAVPERVIVAPAVGVFRPLAAGEEGAAVDSGQAIGIVEGPGAATPVRSPFDGFLVAMLARAGERVREGQPVAWRRLP